VVDANRLPEESNVNPVMRLTPAEWPTIVTLPFVWSTIASAPSLADASGPLFT
jgi:hypothetical protein